MGLRTADEFRAGLTDGRSVFYRGQRIKDVVADPELSLAVDHSAMCFSIAETHPDLAVVDVDGEQVSAFYKLPRSREDLIRRGALIEEVSRQGGGTIVLKEVGSDAMFALLRATTGRGLDNARAFYERVCRDDVALAVAQTALQAPPVSGPG